jgi:hypothetical protein
MIDILPISSELPLITVEMFYYHGLMDSVGIDLGTPVAMLVLSDIGNPFCNGGML